MGNGSYFDHLRSHFLDVPLVNVFPFASYVALKTVGRLLGRII